VFQKTAKCRLLLK